MKRPQSRPTRPSNLPSAPATVKPIDLGAKRQAKTKSTKIAKPPSAKRSARPAKPTKLNGAGLRSAARRAREPKPTPIRPRRWQLLTSVFVVLIITTIMLVTSFSPLLAIQEIKVIGTERLHASSIRNALQGELGVPLTRVDSSKVAAQLESFSLIESVDVIASPPHTLLVRVTERHPIGIVKIAGTPILVDPVGVQIAIAKSYGDYPVIEVTGNLRDNANFRAAVDVLLAIPSDLYPQVATVTALSKDDVTLQLRGYANQQVVWGDGSQSVLKSKVLAAMFKNTKRSVRLTIDVSSPQAPVVRY